MTIPQLIKKYERKGLLLDTVLAILLVVGGHDRKLIGRDKRLSQFIPEDFDALISFIKAFNKMITTPNVLTEINNLVGHLSASDFPFKFAKYIELMDEYYVPSKKICNSELFRDVGITDASLADLGKDQYLILTDDLRLVGKLEKRSIDVINFNHIRTLAWH
jgi:hypothetical protein